MLTGFTGPVQIAYAVSDVHRAAEQWQQRGTTPFHIREHIDVSNARVRGIPAPFDHSSAFAQHGEFMVELICEHPTAITPRVGPVSGIHHVAFFVPNFAAASTALAANGFEQVLYAEAGSMPFAFHDATAELGHLIEIYERTPRLAAFYQLVREQAEAT